MDEHRWAEAEVVAKRAMEMAPDEPVVQQLQLQAKFVRRLANVKAIEVGQRTRLRRAAQQRRSIAPIPFDDNNPMQFGDVKEWDKLTKSPFRRRRSTADHAASEKEIEIEKSLKTPVSLKFQDAPLSEVMDHLKTLAGVNIHLDPRGLAAEGVTTDTPVNIDLTRADLAEERLEPDPRAAAPELRRQERSAQHHQRADARRRGLYRTYNVGDLVVPIPNFTPDGNMGLTGALNSAQANARAGMVGGVYSGDAPLAVASNSGANTNAVMDPRMLAQMASMPAPPMASVWQLDGQRPRRPERRRPARLRQPDRLDRANNSTRELGRQRRPGHDHAISEQPEPGHQPEAGRPRRDRGPAGAATPPAGLAGDDRSAVHHAQRQLLRAYRRRLPDELARFRARVARRCVERRHAGTRSALASYDPQLTQKNSADGRHCRAPGLNQFHRQLERQPEPRKLRGRRAAIRQHSRPAPGATLGFAILSDIEAYFFIEASQGDRRSNVLQAPKVTLFNGQQAFVSDTSQSPFVISVIPVVGDFAAAQQPVIVVLSEGTMLTVQAVVSEDRRFVRLTLVPFFSSIGAVNTFTFTGSSSSTSNSASQGPTDTTTGRSNSTTTTSRGHDRAVAHVLVRERQHDRQRARRRHGALGGVKRLSEGRNEFGVPILNKIPYINRLFQNAAIGRQTQSLMMMVTPRIIIQEEEEFNLTGQTPPTTAYRADVGLASLLHDASAHARRGAIAASES